MNEILAMVYRKDEQSLGRLLQDPRYQKRKKLNEALKIVLGDQELDRAERMRFAEMLLCAGASPNIRNWSNEPILIQSFEAGDLETFKLLLNFGPDVKVANEENRTALHLAAERGNSEVVGLLLAAGANPNRKDQHGNTPLMYALAHVDPDTFSMLLIDTDVNLSNNDKETPLHIAAVHGCVQEMSVLIECGANTDAEDLHGDTPLMVSAALADLDAIRLLIKSGCTINKANLNGNTALHKACACQEKSNVEAVTTLLQEGSKVDWKSLSGNTPLFVAVNSGNAAVVKVLIQANADINARGNVMCYGKMCSPIELAILRDDYLTMVMLLLAGCSYKKSQVERAIAHLTLSRLSTGENSPDTEVFNSKMKMIQYIISRPKSLGDVCRSSIRASLGYGINKKLSDLNLPPKVKDYIALKELDDTM